VPWREPTSRHHAARAVYAEHGHGVVDGPPEVDAVDRVPQSPARPATADRRGLKPRAGAKTAPASRSGGAAAYPSSPSVRTAARTLSGSRSTGALWLCEAFRRIASAGIPVSVAARRRRLRDAAHPQEVGATGAMRAAVVEHQRLRHERLVDPSARPSGATPGLGREAGVSARHTPA
jgi:hypothetical protein